MGETRRRGAQSLVKRVLFSFCALARRYDRACLQVIQYELCERGHRLRGKCAHQTRTNAIGHISFRFCHTVNVRARWELRKRPLFLSPCRLTDAAPSHWWAAFMTRVSSFLHFQAGWDLVDHYNVEYRSRARIFTILFQLVSTATASSPCTRQRLWRPTFGVVLASQQLTSPIVQGWSGRRSTSNKSDPWRRQPQASSLLPE